jgi:hypothetical protein
MSEKTWAVGLAKGAYKNPGSKRVKRKSGKTPRVGIHARRMARRRA